MSTYERPETLTPWLQQGPVLMGVANVTPDSFSDGGRFSSQAGGIDYVAAVDHAQRLIQLGAAIVDVGGEASSFFRPGIASVPAEQQIERVVPVIRRLRTGRPVVRANPNLSVLISVDTRSAEVAREALLAGADIVNDISAGTHDPAMLATVAELGAAIVLMHMRPEQPGQMAPTYTNVVDEVCEYLQDRAMAAKQAGIAAERIILDPGIGFGKSPADNWKLVAGLSRLVALRYPVLLGVSRKRFLAEVLPADRRSAAPEHWIDRDLATAVVTAMAMAAGVQIHRVHNVELAVQSLAITRRLADERQLSCTS